MTTKAKAKSFAWHTTLLGDAVMTCAYTPLDGGETTRIMYEKGELLKRYGPGDYRMVAKVVLPGKYAPGDFTEFEFDLLSSALKMLGYVPGNAANL